MLVPEEDRRLVFAEQTQKDEKKIKLLGLKTQTKHLLQILKENPFQNPPPCEKPLGNLSGANSRRINIQRRLVYQIIDDIETAKIIRIWSHDE